MNPKLSAVCGLIAVGIVSSAFIVLASDEDDAETEYDKYIRAIDTYELFQKGLSGISEPADISSKENYEVFVNIAAKEMKAVFTLEEMRHIAEFYQSPLGRKLSRYKADSKAFDDFLYAVSPPEVWSCDKHPQIRMFDPGQCPVCDRDLVKKRVTKHK